MSKRTPPESIAWLHHAAAAGQADARLMLTMLERIEALEQRPIAGTVELAAPTLETPPEQHSTLLIGAPAPAGGLVERVADAIVTKATWAGIVDDRPARAAIREVADWLDSKGQHGCSLWLREEADR